MCVQLTVRKGGAGGILKMSCHQQSPFGKVGLSIVPEVVRDFRLAALAVTGNLQFMQRWASALL